jgi:hypothetical protein
MFSLCPTSLNPGVTQGKGNRRGSSRTNGTGDAIPHPCNPNLPALPSVLMSHVSPVDPWLYTKALTRSAPCSRASSVWMCHAHAASRCRPSFLRSFLALRRMCATSRFL